MNKKRLLFMGTPDFAIPCLEMLNKREDTQIVGIVTQPDRKAGRGYKLQFSPVKEFALKNDIECVQPISLKDGTFEEYLNQKKPDIIIVIAYGKILPPYVIDYPKFGCINVHASLLPKYRGAAPIQWAVINGEEKTGITTMYMDNGLDTGDIILTDEIKLDEFETAGSLFGKLAELSPNVLSKTVDMLYSDTVSVKKQGEMTTEYASMISKEMSYLNFNDDAYKISRLVRGLNPMPGAKTKYRDKIIKILMAEPLNVNSNEKCGTIIECEKRLVVQCANGTALNITSIQPEGKKVMKISDFLKGNSLIKKDDVLGDE